MNVALEGAVLCAATVASGLVAGLFYAFSVSVMRGLGRTGDSTFVEAMQNVNVAILNGWFALAFVGAPLSTSLTAVLHLDDGTTQQTWILLAWALSVVTLGITLGVNVPLNNTLAAATAADAAAARRHFEARWVQWNLARTVSSTAAFGCLAWALLLHR